MADQLEKQQFQGPQSVLMSNYVCIQDGDFLQPQSQNSYSVPIELSPNNPIKNQIKKTLISGTAKQSVFEEEAQNHGKPEFLKLIIAKSLQNNFITNLWNKSYLRKLHQLTEYQIKTIDDLKFNSTIAESVYDSLYIFTPYSKFIFFWDMSQIILYLFIFFWLPFKISFGINQISQFWNVEDNHQMEFIILTLLSCDVLVGMNMAFIYKGQIIKNRRKIFINYIRYIILFIILVSLAVLTFHFFLHDTSHESIALLVVFAIVFYILRLNKIDKILALIQEFFNLNGSLNDLLALVQMITIIIYIIHICACVWHGIADVNLQPNWIDYYQLRNSEIYVRYNVAIYWATMTMTTVGYGDVTAKNNIETAVNNVTMLIGSIVFAYSVNSIGIFVSNLYKSRQDYNHTVTLINTFMSKNKIQFDLQTRIRSYLQYIWQEEQQMNEEEVGSIVSKLSSHLQDELNFQLKGNILNQCKIITKTFSQKFKQHLLLMMEEQSFSPEERIITLNQQDDNSLYIISKGEVEIIFEGINQNGDVQQKNSLQWLKTGDYFGEISFITGKLRNASAIARGFVRVFKIKREQLLKELLLFPNDYEKFCQLKDQLMMKQSVSSVIQCYSCKSDQHLINECHFHHYCADKESIIKREYFPINQKRKSIYRRNSINKLHPWITQHILTKKAKEYAFSNTITENESEDNVDEINSIYQTSDEEQDEVLMRDDSQSINATQNQNDIEEEDNNKQFKKKRNIVPTNETFKTAGFTLLKQQKQQSIDSPQIDGVIPESKKLINTFQIKPHQGDTKSNPKTSKKRITIIKEVSEERLGSEQFQKTYRQTTKKKSKTTRILKDHSQFTDGYPIQSTLLGALFDKMQIFNYYFPINNYDVILKRYAKIQKFFGKKRLFPESSIYSFFNLTIKKGYKLRKLGLELQNQAGTQKLPSQTKKQHRKSKPALLFGKDIIMNNNQNVSQLQYGEFQGPNPQLLSNKVVLQQGDNQEGSSSSFTGPDQFVIQNFNDQIPQNIDKIKLMKRKRSEYYSPYEQEDGQFQKNKKPQFLRLILAKTLQKKFIDNLWNRSYLKKLNHLSNYQISQLDDLQYEQDSYFTLGRQNSKSLINSLAFWQAIEIFTPYSKFIVIWDVFQIITYIMIFFWLPFKLSFQIYFISDLFDMENTKIFEIILLSILALDVLVGLNLAFIFKGQIITERKRVIINYFNHKYLIQFMVSFFTVSAQFFIPSLDSEDNVTLITQIILCAIFYILRITKINKILAQIQEFFNLNASLNDLVGLMKLLMVIIFIAHICGCIWHGFGHYDSSYSWLDAYNLRDKSNGTKYNYSIYWATMTMTTVGYGDITAKNNSELIINNITMFVASIVFAYSVNSIGIFVSNIYKGNMEYRKSVTLINNFMSKNKINFELQTKIRSYLEYIWEEEQERNENEIGSITKKLSRHLQDDLQYELRGNILKNCKVIMKLFSQQFVKSLIQSMEEMSFSPEERIITCNQIDDCSLYIISKGEVELIFSGKNQQDSLIKKNTIKCLSQNDCFGEVAFFTGNSRSATAISKGFTKVFKIKRENFLFLLKSFPNDYEKFCDVRDKLVYNEYSKLQLNCFSCNSNQHLINQCHILHYCADHERIIKKELYPIQQQRNIRFFRQQNIKTPQSQSMCNYYSKRAYDLMQDLNSQEKGRIDLEDGDSHIYLMHDAYDNENRYSSVNQFRSQSRTLSKVSQKQSQQIELNEEDKNNQAYGRGQTASTAGFGVHKSIEISWNVEQLSDSSNSSENQDQLIIQKQHTFLKTDEKMKSKTSLQRQISKTESNEENLKLSRKNQSNIIKHSDLEVKFQHQREPAKKNTNQIRNRTGDYFMQNNITNSALNMSIFYYNFDKMTILQYYQPLNNYDTVIKRYTRAQKYFGKKRLFPESSLYTFYFNTIKKGWKLRKLAKIAQNDISKFTPNIKVLEKVVLK